MANRSFLTTCLFAEGINFSIPVWVQVISDVFGAAGQIGQSHEYGKEVLFDHLLLPRALIFHIPCGYMQMSPCWPPVVAEGINFSFPVWVHADESLLNPQVQNRRYRDLKPNEIKRTNRGNYLLGTWEQALTSDKGQNWCLASKGLTLPDRPHEGVRSALFLPRAQFYLVDCVSQTLPHLLSKYWVQSTMYKWGKNFKMHSEHMAVSMVQFNHSPPFTQ